MRPLPHPAVLLTLGLWCLVTGCSFETDLERLCEQAGAAQSNPGDQKTPKDELLLTLQAYSPATSEGKALKASLLRAKAEVAYEVALEAAGRQGHPQWRCPALEARQEVARRAGHAARCERMRQATKEVATQVVPAFEAAVLQTVKKEIAPEKWPQFKAIFDKEKAQALGSPDPKLAQALKETLEAFGCGETLGEPSEGACKTLPVLLTQATNNTQNEAIGGAFAQAMMGTGEVTAEDIAAGSKRFDDLLSAAATEGTEASKATLLGLVKATGCTFK